jgi:hypothetical protein
MQYQLAPGHETDRGFGPGGSWRLLTTFHPPLLRGQVFLGRVRWQIGLPAGVVPLYPADGASAEQRWGWRGWMPAPRAALSSADLERWFSGAESDTRSDEEPSLVCWQTSLTPLHLVHMSQIAWLLLCSLLMLVLGLGLYYVALSRGQFWTVVAGLSLLVVLAGVLWPNVLPAVVYGCEPGLLILGLVFGFLWVRQQRYRRQLVFMPGFSRLKTGSSLVRSKGSSHRARGEPSTVDVAPSSGSS